MTHDLFSQGAVTPGTAIERTGFAYPGRQLRKELRRSAALAQLIAVAALIASIAVVATTVSFGMTSAEGLAATPIPASHQAVSKRPNSMSRPGAASNNARV
jgi:hypothetical protein